MKLPGGVSLPSGVGSQISSSVKSATNVGKSAVSNAPKPSGGGGGFKGIKLKPINIKKTAVNVSLNLAENGKKYNPELFDNVEQAIRTVADAENIKN